MYKFHILVEYREVFTFMLILRIFNLTPIYLFTKYILHYRLDSRPPFHELIQFQYPIPYLLKGRTNPLSFTYYTNFLTIIKPYRLHFQCIPVSSYHPPSYSVVSPSPIFVFSLYTRFDYQLELKLS